MRAVSLFSGVGGFEQGLQRAGIETVLQVENDPWCLSVLARHWPEVQRIDDVRKVDAATFQGRCRDVVGVRPGPDAERLGGAARGATGPGDQREPANNGPDDHEERCYLAGYGEDDQPDDAPDDARRRTDGRDGESARGGPSTDLHASGQLGRRQAGPGIPGDIDLVYGGFPCQDVSVAGQRRGLSGDRSGLWHEFHRVLSELRPRWTVIENVPGLLSSGAEPGADFGVVLRGLVDLGYGVAWRVLDARHFGVPQRRRRVFVVGCLGDAPRAAAVLAVCESCGGHPQTRREERQDASTETDGGITGTLSGHHGNVRADQAWTNQLVAGSFQQSSLAGKGTFGYDEDPDVLKPVKTQSDGQMIVIGSQIDEGSARPLVAKPSGYRMDMESETFVAAGSMGVRRLTPREAERLQGWADDWTRYTADGKEIPDSHRYRCIGNGVVAPVAEWIGHRLVEADTW
jgi:DNA (cytosine-5)-methyltransferase 1